MIKDTQLPEKFRAIIDEEVANYEGADEIQDTKEIPDTAKIPLEGAPNKWLKVPDVICVFVDMKNSTELAAQPVGKAVVKPMRLFTATAVKLFDKFDAPYIDVQGDGAFALFNSGQVHRALSAAVTFKTFADAEFRPRVKKRWDVDVGSHVGIDCRNVFVRRIGFRHYGGRTDRQNEVWAGKPVNMAAKLASRSSHNELWVSSRFYNKLSDERALKSCGCPDGDKVDLWTKKDVSEETNFDFKNAYVLNSNWCEEHGEEFCDALLRAD